MIARDNERQLLREAAIAYANTGWPVFPLRPGTKRPATPNHTVDTCNGSDPRCSWSGHTGWEQRATTDVGRITRAWDRHPYGIGIACGPAGLVVVDLDTAKDGAATGVETLAELEHQSGSALPATWTVGTPSGGRHLYYRRPTECAFGNTAARVGPGIDTRAIGGYVVAPPTTTEAGEYWLIDDHPPSELPDWFGQLITAPERTSPASVRSSPPRASSDRPTNRRLDRYVAAALEAEHRRILSAVAGRRNHTLFLASIAVGQLVGAQLLDRHEAEQLLLEAAQTHVATGAYGAGQARQTIASGLRRGTAEPRQLPIDFYATQGASS